MSKEEILKKLAAHEIEVEVASKLLAELDKPRGNLYCKVSEKKALSVYGLQRMPITLYKEQWDRLIAFVPEIQRFMAENEGRFSLKADKA